MNTTANSRLISINADDHGTHALIDALRDAGGQPLTFGDLLDRGVTEPAHGLRTLELAGYRVERVRVPAAGGEVLAFRLVGEPRQMSLGARPSRGAGLLRAFRERAQHS